MESVTLGQHTFDINEVNRQLSELAEETKLQEDLTETPAVGSPMWVSDIADMHQHFGVNPVVRNFDKEKLLKFLEFRLNFLQEELNEAKAAYSTLVDMQISEIHPDARKAAAVEAAADIVDACIDLCVVAIGTLNAYDVDAEEAWNRVHRANMAKNPGIKPERPNPLGLPDLIKPAGWTAPTHEDNIGLLSKLAN